MANVERNRTFIRRWIEILTARTNRNNAPNGTYRTLPDDLLYDVIPNESPLRKEHRQRVADVARATWFKYGVDDR